MRAVGLLASGIAHEINTPAQFVTDNLHFALDGVADLLSVIESQSMSLAAEGGADPAKVIDVDPLRARAWRRHDIHAASLAPRGAREG
jgi:hypothetical protein